MTGSQSPLGVPNQKERKERKRSRKENAISVGCWPQPHCQPCSTQLSTGRSFANTCFCLHLISFLVNSHKPDPADLENDEKAECWGPEGMKGDGGGPRGGHMTQGRQWLKASPLSPCSGPVLEGSGDFLPPPTRPTDVERSPVPRDLDTTACCFPLADGACDHRQTSYTVTHQRAEPSQVRGSNLLGISAARKMYERNRMRVKQHHTSPCVL